MCPQGLLKIITDPIPFLDFLFAWNSAVELDPNAQEDGTDKEEMVSKRSSRPELEASDSYAPDASKASKGDEEDEQAASSSLRNSPPHREQAKFKWVYS